MIAAVVHLIHGNKRKERIAVDYGVHNPIVDQTSGLLSVRCLSHVRVLAFLSPRDVVYLDTALTNHSLRSHFHMYLNGVVVRGPVNFLSLSWFQARRSFMDKLVVTSRVKNIATIHAVNKISELHLRGAAEVSASDLQLMLTNCRKLTKLAVSIPSRLHDLTFDAIRQPLPLLTLYLDGNYQIENATVVSLLEKCPHLQALHANDCGKLTPDVVRAIAKNCPELQEIYFNWGERIYDIKKLSDALLAETVYDPDSCYCELFRSCTKLKVVDLFRRSYGTGNIVTPLDVLTLAQHCTQLTHVKLSSTRSLCRQRDTTGLWSIRQRAGSASAT